jgi:hypothetical protein
MYAGLSVRGALYESAFHSVPVAGKGRRVFQSQVAKFELHLLVNDRDLNLADLRGTGPGRIGTSRAELIEAPQSEYLDTAAWAEAVLEECPLVDGLAWTSRQDDTEVVVLLVDRVGVQVSLQSLGLVQRLGDPGGIVLADEAATRAGIHVVRP